MKKRTKSALTIPTPSLRLVRMHRPALEPLDISNSGNARNQTTLDSSTLRNALNSKAIRQRESRRIRFGQNVNGGGWSHRTRKAVVVPRPGPGTRLRLDSREEPRGSGEGDWLVVGEAVQQSSRVRRIPRGNPTKACRFGRDHTGRARVGWRGASERTRRLVNGCEVTVTVGGLVVCSSGTPHARVVISWEVDG